MLKILYHALKTGAATCDDVLMSRMAGNQLKSLTTDASRPRAVTTDPCDHMIRMRSDCVHRPYYIHKLGRRRREG